MSYYKYQFRLTDIKVQTSLHFANYPQKIFDNTTQQIECRTECQVNHLSLISKPSQRYLVYQIYKNTCVAYKSVTQLSMMAHNSTNGMFQCNRC